MNSGTGEIVPLKAQQRGFNVAFQLGDEVQLHGQTLVLTYVNYDQRRLTFTPKVALHKMGDRNISFP